MIFTLPSSIHRKCVWYMYNLTSTHGQPPPLYCHYRERGLHEKGELTPVEIIGRTIIAAVFLSQLLLLVDRLLL